MKPIEIDMKEVKSSNITSVGYKDKILRIKYKYGTYDYADVPEEKYKALLEADSVGKFINKFIKGIHSFKKLAGTGFGGYA